MENSVQDQGMWTELKPANYFIKALWNLVNENAFDCYWPELYFTSELFVMGSPDHE